ncbi:hypothetical protein R1flu_012462 [Riccia fluitans]|uniref:Uncharacterized protein n=1 Tax=Riccia fluitans TaxID=41844 RepID=A0ABD1ZAV5_9MARC
MSSLGHCHGEVIGYGRLSMQIMSAVEENAGVLITSMVDAADNLMVERDLLGFCSDDPCLVQWPIIRLKVKCNGAMLSDLYKAYDDSEFVKQAEDAAEPVLKEEEGIQQCQEEEAQKCPKREEVEAKSLCSSK